jgi:ribosomal-protein-alanine N-acetyltransferase
MIRELCPSDVEACIDLVRMNWDETVAARFTDEISHAFDSKMSCPPLYYVFVENNKIIGFAGMIRSWIMHSVWDFIWINVHPDHKGKGIGKLLTIHRINEVDRMGGSIIQLMTEQYHFFKKLGFRVNILFDGDEMWMHMTKQLRPIHI